MQPAGMYLPGGRSNGTPVAFPTSGQATALRPVSAGGKEAKKKQLALGRGERLDRQPAGAEKASYLMYFF